ncbi:MULTISPECIES: hypothetical protein [Enterobacterales]|uniref:hypothetical protein n=1 Tax=Enterobacterales TaxID=91347 RepID=UPI002ED7844B
MRSFHRAVNSKINNDNSSKSALVSRKEITAADDGHLKAVRYKQSVITSETGVRLSADEKKLISYNKYLEAAISISILDKPGGIAIVLDRYTLTLADVFEKLLQNKQDVFFNNARMPLLEVFTRTTFNPMSSGSDQIGRMPVDIEGSTPQWLIQQLRQPLAPNNGYLLMLTKMKAVSSFGTTIWQLLTVINPEQKITNTQVITDLLGSVGSFPNNISPENHIAYLTSRFDEFKQKTRSALFDSSISRARSERMPLMNKETNKKFDGVYTNAASHGLGFGQVIQHASSQEQTRQLRGLLDNGTVRNARINAIDRFDAPIGDLNRPFMLSEDEFNKFPDDRLFKKLKQKIEDHYFNHGVGINRWQPYGTYSLDSSNFGYPSAGAQSGGTTDILLAMIMLGLKENSLYGDKKSVLPMVLAAAAFMNFGGYHTFAEVLPIGEAVTQNQIFNPANIADVFRYGSIYSQMLVLYFKYGDRQESVSLQKFESAHRALTKKTRDNLFHPQPNDW